MKITEYAGWKIKENGEGSKFEQMRCYVDLTRTRYNNNSGRLSIHKEKILWTMLDAEAYT